MRLKLDENIPATLAAPLRALGHDVDTSIDEGLLGEKDEAVWMASQQSQRALITQDLDFSDARKFAPGSHHGIILVRLFAPSREAIIDRVVQALSLAAADEWSRCVVVISEKKVRIRLPSPPEST